MTLGLVVAIIFVVILLLAIVFIVLYARASSRVRGLKKTVHTTTRYGEEAYALDQETQTKLDRVSGDLAGSFDAGIDILHDAAQRRR